MYTPAGKLKVALLVIGDIAAAYCALFTTIVLRYGTNNLMYYWDRHLWPFTVIFLGWLLILYIVGLYEYHNLHGRLELLSKTGEALAAAFLVSLAVFYFVASFRITPKTNLLIAMLIFAVLFVGWRILTLSLFARRRFQSRLLFLGAAPEAAALCQMLNQTPQLGFHCLGVVERDDSKAIPESDFIVVSHLLKDDDALTRRLYENFFASRIIVDFPSFYERIRRAVPASALTEHWVLHNLAQRETSVFDHLKRPFDALLATALAVPAIVLTPIIAAAIWLGDHGPVLFRQIRVGRGGKMFPILKFRTMRTDAEAAGAAFADKDDARVTTVGRFLRATRLDELPQLFNILKGQMSFVGPRPERPEFEKELSKTLPLFPVRHLVRPGLTGWAQVNAPYAASVEDHENKLRHDLYYLKHRSFTLDLAIILRTSYSVFKRTGR